jgi:hypothetical protein
MTPWETPSFDEIAMNAEIGSYQDDLDRPADPEWPETPETIADSDARED